MTKKEEKRASSQPRLVAPISKLGLKNFRSIEESSVILRPLTIVVGGNSAGKSSVLSSLRLLKQAAVSGERNHVFPLEGVEIELGQFDDLLRQGSSEQSIEMSLAFQLISPQRPSRIRSAESILSRLPTEGVWAEVRLQLGKSTESAGLAQVQEMTIRVVHEDRDLEFVNLNVSSDPRELPQPIWPWDFAFRWQRDAMGMTPDRRRVADVYETATSFPLFGDLVNLTTNQEVSVFSRLGSGGIPNVFETVSTPVEVLYSTIRRLLDLDTEEVFRQLSGRPKPGRVRQANEYLVSNESTLERILSQSRVLRSIGRSVGRDSFLDLAEILVIEYRTAKQFVRELKDLDPHSLAEQASAVDKNSDEGRKWTTSYGFTVDSLQETRIPLIMNQLAFLFERRLSHMGPLRQGPRRLYAFGERSAANELGREAQYFAYFLRNNADVKVDGFFGSASVTLTDALSHWAEYLGVATSIQVLEEPGYGRKVLVKLPGLRNPVDWEKVGVGVSQILPVLLKVLTSNEGSVTLIEQPELHLHPDAQAALADFLISAARKGRNLIIESHSDAMITRIRRRVAEETLESIDGISRHVTFIFASRDDEFGVTSLRNVELNDEGAFSDWPRGFADQVAREARELLKRQLEIQEKASSVNYPSV